MMMMTCLSKNTFKLYAHEGEIPDDFIDIYNQKVLVNKYLDFNNLQSSKYIKKELAFKLKYGRKFNAFIIYKPCIIVGHGSIVKAELFDDHERFIPTTLNLLIMLFNEQSKIINNLFISHVLETFNHPNNTHYFLESAYEIEKFMSVNKEKHIFLAYRQ